MHSVDLASPARSRVWSALGALLLVFGVATASHAANTITAGSLITYINVLDPIIAPLNQPVAAGVSRDGSNLLTTLTFGASAFKATGIVVDVTDPGAYPIDGVQATAKNAPANFARANGKMGGTMALIGVNKVCLFFNCSGAVSNLSVPISVVGDSGTATVTGAVNLTVIGAPWTQGTAAVGTITRMGNAGQATQVTNGTQITNTLQLVSPVFVSTNIAQSSVVPVWAVLDLTLQSAPEPGTLAAFGVAIVSLVAVGFARRR